MGGDRLVVSAALDQRYAVRRIAIIFIGRQASHFAASNRIPVAPENVRGGADLGPKAVTIIQSSHRVLESG